MQSSEVVLDGDECKGGLAQDRQSGEMPVDEGEVSPPNEAGSDSNHKGATTDQQVEASLTEEKWSRADLYKRVWEEPMTKLARRCGVSDVRLAEICRDLLVPVPPRGYWQKKRSGKGARRKPLPKLPEDEDKQFWLRVFLRSPEDEAPTEAGLSIADEKKKDNRLVVPARLESPHPLIEKTERSLKSAKPESDGLVQSKAKGCLNVCVAPESVERAMRILDTLVKALEKRGIPVTVGAEASDPTRVKVLEETLTIELDEELDRCERQLTARQIQERARFPPGCTPPGLRLLSLRAAGVEDRRLSQPELLKAELARGKEPPLGGHAERFHRRLVSSGGGYQGGTQAVGRAGSQAEGGGAATPRRGTATS